MQIDYNSLLRRDERIRLALCGLYERYGYQKFRMSRFEEYDFYALHRDFLPGGQIITFTGLDGRLMALRPDVTLSIVKETKADADGCERLYYTEPVYRPSRRVGEYRESAQVGLEYLGALTPYARVEVVLLALQSLRQIQADTVLNLSHTGYVQGLLDGLPIGGEIRGQIRRCIEEKNTHELSRVAADCLPEADVARLTAVARLSGPFADTLPRARALSRGDTMARAVDELTALYAALSACPEAEALRLDFSVTSDADYYSGLVFRGYVSGVPDVVLSGGRYDPLLRRMGRDRLSAMGFAIYFDELARFLSAEANTSVDTVVLYAPETSPAAVARTVGALVAAGERVWAGEAPPKGLGWRRVVEVDEHA